MYAELDPKKEYVFNSDKWYENKILEWTKIKEEKEMEIELVSKRIEIERLKKESNLKKLEKIQKEIEQIKKNLKIE